MTIEPHIIVGLLVAAIVVSIASKRARLPYNVALVVGGMLIAIGELMPGMPRLEPQFVFLLCLPALLFEGGITADLGSIRRNIPVIGTLATLGMLISIGVTGSFLKLGLDLPWGSALLLGSMLSVTDTVSVLYAFRRAAVPPRLSAVVQGESLFNDGTALVAYTALTAVALSAAPSLPGLGARLLLATFGGLIVGVALGLLTSFIIRWAEEPLLGIMATSAVALASYTAAEQLHLSGAIAAVTAGLTVSANLRRRMSPQGQLAISSFWEYVAFGVNTFLFLSVGLTTQPESLLGNVPEVLLAFGAVIVGRAAGIYPVFWVLGFFQRSTHMPLRWQHVFVIGNIKGALSIALALGVPAAVPGRDLLINVAFGVTFISLIGQGLLLTPLLRGFGLVRKDPIEDQAGRLQAEIIAARAAQRELEEMHQAGLVSRLGYERLRSEYQGQIASADRELRRIYDRHLAYGVGALLSIRRRLIDAERHAISDAGRTGMIPEAAAAEAIARREEAVSMGGADAHHREDHK